MKVLKFIKERLNEYDANSFINELASASKGLGILEAKVSAYQFNNILIPMLHKKEAISSMYIEGTQTTISDVLENEVNPKPAEEKKFIEVSNHTRTLIYGADYLRTDNFTHSFIQSIHRMMMENLLTGEHEKNIGKYKNVDNRIENSAGTVIFVPPTCKETKKYMDELIQFMNDDNDDIHPLIKAAIIHSQFESIHPFTDGNGRVGRLLVSLYLFKAKVINFPFFYISEAISQDKTIYYKMLTNSRNSTYDEWIKYFLKKIIIQTEKHIGYIDSLNKLYVKTKCIVQENINSTKSEYIIECMFNHPVLTAAYLADKLTISRGQAMRYLNTLESKGILLGDDKQRGRTFFFADLIDLAR